MTEPVPQLVAHRGYPRRYPENTIEGIRAALNAGACFVEFDVQLSADGLPIVIHDQNLQRTADVDLCVFDVDYEELSKHPVGEDVIFNGRFRNAHLPSLAEVSSLFAEWPKATAVIEIKRSSLRHHGRVAVLQAVYRTLASLPERSILISFEHGFIDEVKRGGEHRTGWIIEKYNAQNLALARQLQPDYLICKEDLLPEPGEPLWQGPWQWMVYTVDEPQHALDLAERGVALVATDAIGEMLRHPVLKKRSCKHA